LSSSSEVIVVDQPFGERQFGVEQPGAERPLEGGGGDAEDAVDQGQRIRRLGRVVEVEDFAERRAGGVGDGIALAGAAAAAVAFGGAGHAADVEQRGAIDRLEIALMAIPGIAVDLVMQRGDLGEHGEDAGGRAQVAAPDALFLAVEQADAERRQRSSRRGPAGRLAGIRRR
jgi:hypothetical protein